MGKLLGPRRGSFSNTFLFYPCVFIIFFMTPIDICVHGRLSGRAVRSSSSSFIVQGPVPKKFTPLRLFRGPEYFWENFEGSLKFAQLPRTAYNELTIFDLDENFFATSSYQFPAWEHLPFGHFRTGKILRRLALND